MTVYAVLAIIVLIGLIGLLFMWQRPRTAEETLAQAAEKAGAGGQQRGESVRDVIKGLVNRRATGLLTVADGAETCSICFLFGHMFHAWCGAVRGEEAVQWALRRQGALCRFDATAKLPVEETITRPTESLLEAS